MPAWAAVRTMAMAVSGIMIIAAGSPAAAQFLPTMQARTPEEFDAYLEALSGQPAAARFLSAYPQSELRLPVYESLAVRCRGQGNAACAVDAARRGLEVAPDYIPLLTLRASVEANTSPRPDGAAARRALQLLANAKAPRQVSPETWLSETARLRAENLATLAMVAYKTDNNKPRAVQLLEQSLAESPVPANQYRLAMLYLESGRAAPGRTLLERASKSPDAAIAARAAAALKSIQLR